MILFLLCNILVGTCVITEGGTKATCPLTGKVSLTYAPLPVYLKLDNGPNPEIGPTVISSNVVNPAPTVSICTATGGLSTDTKAFDCTGTFFVNGKTTVEVGKMGNFWNAAF